MVTYQRTRAGGGIIADGKFVPPDTRNRDWVAYLAFVAADGVAGPPLAATLSEEKAGARGRIEIEAAARTVGGPSRDLLEEARFAQSQIAISVPIDEGDVPLLAARMAITDELYADAAEAVIQEFASARAVWAKVEAAKQKAVIDVDAADDAEELDTIIAAVDWDANVPPLKPAQDQTQDG